MYVSRDGHETKYYTPRQQQETRLIFGENKRVLLSVFLSLTAYKNLTTSGRLVVQYTTSLLFQSIRQRYAF